MPYSFRSHYKTCSYYSVPQIYLEYVSFIPVDLSKELREEIKLTADILGISVEEANVKRVGRRPDDYIFVYKQHIKCSDADLNTLEVFMNFEEEVVATNAAATTSATATNSATSLKLEPFMYDNATLLQLWPHDDALKQAIENPAPPSRYAWVKDPLYGWGWSEHTWNERLGSCLALAFPHIMICEAFRWAPSTYKANLLSIFPNLAEPHLHITPFLGFTDFCLFGKQGVSVVTNTVASSFFQDSVEVGINNCVEVRCTSGARATLPKKLGELIANTYYFASLYHLNSKFNDMPSSIEWKAHGMLIVRSMGIITIEMIMDADNCRVVIRNKDFHLQNLGLYLEEIVEQLN